MVKRPIVFTTLVNMDDTAQVLQKGCQGMLLDMFGTFVHPLEHGTRDQIQPPDRAVQRRQQEQGVPGAASRRSTSRSRTTMGKATGTWSSPT
jgi:hypothetical protein